MMKQVLLVFLGGGAGSILRFLISRSLQNQSGIPYGTFTVNILGSLLIGILIGLSLRNNLISNNLYLLLATGFCGGFTTFSAFAAENQAFLRAGDLYHFALYSLGSLIFGFGAVFVGLFLSRLF